MTNSEIEIFRTGRFQSIDGRWLAFGDGDLAATAAFYDPALHKAPHVVGHPKMDAPAYGWVTSLAHKGDRLVANIDQCDPAFADLVKTGRFGTVSAAFYDPDDDNNPVPGTYYLRHVGWLGATPPAVKGLKQAQFAGADKFIAFAEDAPAPDAERGLLARIVRSLVRSEISRAVDPAAALPLIEEYDMNQSPAFAERERSLADRERQLNERGTQLEQRETAVKTKETAFSESEKARFKKGNEAVLEQLEQEGRVIPAWRPVLLAFMERMQGAPAIAFGEGDDKIETPLIAAFHEFLGLLPKQVHFGEFARTPVDDGRRRIRPFVAPRGRQIDEEGLELRNRALAYAEKNKVSFVEAVQRVSAES